MIGENSSDFLNFVSKSRGFEYQQEKNRTFKIKKIAGIFAYVRKKQYLCTVFTNGRGLTEVSDAGPVNQRSLRDSPF